MFHFDTINLLFIFHRVVKIFSLKLEVQISESWNKILNQDSQNTLKKQNFQNFSGLRCKKKSFKVVIHTMEHMTIYKKIPHHQHGNSDMLFFKIIQNKSRIMPTSVSLDYILFISAIKSSYILCFLIYR